MHKTLKHHKTLAKITLLGSLLTAHLLSSQHPIGSFALPYDTLSGKKLQEDVWLLSPSSEKSTQCKTLKNKYRLCKKRKQPRSLEIDDDEPFDIFVYGNLTRRARKKEDTIAHNTVAYIARYLEKSPRAPALHLLMGNLTKSGSSSHELVSFLTHLKNIVHTSMVASALGMKEIYTLDPTSKLPVASRSPVMANFWHTVKPFHQKRSSLLTNAQSNRCFTIGCVRFIHLPLIDSNTIEDHPEVVHDFITNVRRAHQDKKKGSISFIIVYTHIAPVTHPQYTHRYKGLFEHPTKPGSAYGHAIAQLEDCLQSYAIDVIFAGHNRIYSRVHWHKDGNTIPIINIGIGTQLESLAHDITIDAQKTVRTATIRGEMLLDKNSFKTGKTKQNMLGFIKAQINPAKKTLQITLLGTPYTPGASCENYTELDSIVIPARKAVKLPTPTYTIEKEFPGFGPFFIPTKKAGLFDMFIVNPSGEDHVTYQCNGQEPIFQKPIYYGGGNIDFISKFSDIALPNGTWTLTKEEEIIAQGKLGTIDTTTPFHIHICGDTRATFDDQYDIYKQLIRYIETYEDLVGKKAHMQLNTGDLISFGGIGAHWGGFFEMSNNLWQGRLVHAALGNHELYADPDNIYTSMVPYFANIFYLPAWREASRPHTYLNETTTWFDVGPVRFLHLPYIQPGFMHGVSPNPLDLFLTMVEQTNQDIAKTDTHLKYVVWLTHRPFIGVRSKYKPIFSDERPGYADMT